MSKQHKCGDTPLITPYLCHTIEYKLNLLHYQPIKQLCDPTHGPKYKQYNSNLIYKHFYIDFFTVLCVARHNYGVNT
jgi:hypothetical protein